MGLFGLFDKKTCDLCGGEIGLLGNRKLEDGNCCKECAKKLSPWFDERRHSTVEQIREQLAYREENKKAVEQFHITRTIARDSWKVLLDEDVIATGSFVDITEAAVFGVAPGDGACLIGAVLGFVCYRQLCYHAFVGSVSVEFSSVARVINKNVCSARPSVEVAIETIIV